MGDVDGGSGDLHQQWVTEHGRQLIQRDLKLVLTRLQLAAPPLPDQQDRHEDNRNRKREPATMGELR